MVMLFGPRDDAELDTVTGVVKASHAWASGQLTVVQAR
jgi:phospholipase/carboxylesterase